MKNPLNLSLLSRVLSQPWAIRRETLVTLTQALLSGDSQNPPAALRDVARHRPSADTSWNVLQWSDDGQLVRAPVKMTSGYTAFNFEGLYADLRGALPALPENLHVMLLWGTLGRGWTQEDRWWMDPIDVDEVVNAVAKTPEGSTVILWFRSPGGIVTGVGEAASALRALAKTRRLIAFTDDLCASAAYWLAAQCEEIVATPSAEVGSIGVYLAFYDFCGMLEQAGIKLELFRAGALKGIGIPGNPLDAAARDHLAKGVEEWAVKFKSAVTDMRKLDDSTMQGQCLLGSNAFDANLVDNFATSAAAFFASFAA